MYSPLNVKANVVQTGAAQVAGIAGQFTVANTADGLSVDTSGIALPGNATMPDRLFNWLLDLRLLRKVPLSYLVADAALLPAESIRFFNVDLTWVDRLIDGVFSAANTGTVDITYSVGMLQLVRTALDGGLQDIANSSAPGTSWSADQGMTGMLIRSDLVRRWPDLIVRAYNGTDEKTAPLAPVLRAEPISKDVYIAIFGGAPQLVQVREPHVGVRFGLEYDENTKQYYYELRKPDDCSLTNAGAPVHQNVALNPGRVVPVHTIAGAAPNNVPRNVAIQLMRQPYVQQFMNSLVVNSKTVAVPESRGSTYPPSEFRVRSGNALNLQALTTTLESNVRMGKG